MISVSLKKKTPKTNRKEDLQWIGWKSTALSLKVSIIARQKLSEFPRKQQSTSSDATHRVRACNGDQTPGLWECVLTTQTNQIEQEDNLMHEERQLKSFSTNCYESPTEE